MELKPKQVCLFAWTDPTKPRKLTWAYSQNFGEHDLLKVNVRRAVCWFKLDLISDAILSNTYCMVGVGVARICETCSVSCGVYSSLFGIGVF